MRGVDRVSRGYLVAIATTVGLIGAFVAGLNFLVDPLWYGRGNSLGPFNYAFNERLSKVNLLLPRLKGYDCIIFGSSRSTLLPEDKVPGYRCFNLSFSSGVVSEFLSFGRYLKVRGFDPKLMIVGVDDFGLTDDFGDEALPDFVRTNRDPPSALRTYLSVDALSFSLRSLFEKSTLDRVYDREFRCLAPPEAPRYVPPSTISPRSLRFDPARAKLFGELRRLFPRAVAIGYVPPMSVWKIAELEEGRSLDGYLKELAAVAPQFDRFFDYGVPTSATADPAQTYDGSHYSASVNEGVAAALISGMPGEGLDWHKTDVSTAAQIYRDRLRRFLGR